MAFYALLALPCGLAVAAENGSANNPANRSESAQASAAARACFDKTEELRLACASRAMSDSAKQACYRVQDEEVKAKNCKAPIER